jgi:hypothetical protein
MKRLFIMALAPLSMVASQAMAQATQTVEKTVETPLGTQTEVKQKVEPGKLPGEDTEVHKTVTATTSTKETCKTRWHNGQKMRTCSVKSKPRQF